MSTKTLIWFFVFTGSTIGGYVPVLWGDSLLSYISILGSGIGGLVGVWVGFKIGTAINN